MGAAWQTAALSKHAGHATAYKIRTVRASPAATQPPCPHFGPCGGCQHQNLQYAAQLTEKQAQVGSAVMDADTGTPSVQKLCESVHCPRLPHVKWQCFCSWVKNTSVKCAGVVGAAAHRWRA